MTWTEYKKEFEWDGSWRDIYILKTGIGDWQQLIGFLRKDLYSITFKIGENVAPLPADAAEIFHKRNQSGVLMSVQVDGITLNCHFFTEEEIEFDIDPREVNSEERLKELFGFMRRIGQLLQKEVILTPENGREAAIFRYMPETDKMKYSQLSS